MIKNTTYANATIDVNRDINFWDIKHISFKKITKGIPNVHNYMSRRGELEGSSRQTSNFKLTNKGEPPLRRQAA